MGLQEEFDDAVNKARTILDVDKMSQDEKLEMYSLFKQGSEGDCTTGRPGIFDQKGRYKWDAWNAKKGMAQDEAKAAYIKHVEAMLAKYPKA